LNPDSIVSLVQVFGRKSSQELSTSSFIWSAVFSQPWDAVAELGSLGYLYPAQMPLIDLAKRHGAQLDWNAIG